MDTIQYPNIYSRDRYIYSDKKNTNYCACLTTFSLRMGYALSLSIYI